MQANNCGDKGTLAHFPVSAVPKEELMQAKAPTLPTMSVPEAGAAYFGIGRNASYEAVRRGEIPVIKIGKLLRVPRAALERIVNGQASAA
jgi:excisionase family DNA binding protein